MTGLSPAGLGYCKYSTTQSRPRSSKLAVTGWRTIGSAAKTSTWNPCGTTIRRTASSGVNPPGSFPVPALRTSNHQNQPAKPEHRTIQPVCPWRSYPRCRAPHGCQS